ncbi:DnaD domain protein [Dorea sp. OM02-2LB]|nr:DnaD domain protein [Dorea sp. OM02-2LB]
MKKLTIRNKFQNNATMISNEFIDHYMTEANGEFVKVYLFLLRHLDDSCFDMSISRIADCLNNTENDIIRAFRYWESHGLLSLDSDAEGNITGICLQKTASATGMNAQDRICSPVSPAVPAGSLATPVVPSTASAPEAVPTTDKPAGSSKAIPLNSFRTQRELKNLYIIAEQYLGKTLTATEIETITYFYKELGLSADIIDYLLASCVENGHKSIHYIQKVALSWSEAKITTIEEARMYSSSYNKNCYTVLNAFGIKGRAPAASEVAYIEKWTGEYGFTLDIIKEACDRTIAGIHQPSFEYADRILSRWSKSGVRHLQDIAPLDQAFQKARSEKKASKAVSAASKNLNNFERRAYDMDSLEAQLLKTN